VLTPMGNTAVEKTEEVLRNEIDELLRKQREVFFLSLHRYLKCVRFFLMLVDFCRLRRGFEILVASAEVPWRVLPFELMVVFAKDPSFALLVFLNFTLSLGFFLKYLKRLISWC